MKKLEIELSEHFRVSLHTDNGGGLKRSNFDLISEMDKAIEKGIREQKVIPEPEDTIHFSFKKGLTLSVTRVIPVVMNTNLVSLMIYGVSEAFNSN